MADRLFAAVIVFGRRELITAAVTLRQATEPLRLFGFFAILLALFCPFGARGAHPLGRQPAGERLDRLTDFFVGVERVPGLALLRLPGRRQ